MVFGIGEGKIDIIIDRLSYIQGDKVAGKVRLGISSPKKANGVRLELRVERTAGSGKNRRTEVLHSFVLELDKEKEYRGNEEYEFEVVLPKLQAPQKPDGILGNIVDIAQAFGAVASPPRWYLKASLDVPMSIDITKQVQLSVQ